MADPSVKPATPAQPPLPARTDMSRGVSRRDVLRAAGAAAIGSLLTAGRTTASEQVGPGEQAAQGQPGDQGEQLVPGAPEEVGPYYSPVRPPPPWWVGPEYPRARIVDIRARPLQPRGTASLAVFGDMIEQGILRMSNVVHPAEAWRKILGPAEIIALKFDSVGAATIGTTPLFAEALVKSLRKAGFPTTSLRLIGTPDYLQRHLGTTPPPVGWGEDILFGDQRDQAAAWLWEAHAIINIPFLKTNRLAGLSGAMMNVAYAAVRHPARLHANGCAPHIGRIIGHPAIAGRLKLSIVNAQRTVIRKGPDVDPDDLWDHGGALLGFDPVALDAVGRILLMRQRQEAGLTEPLEVPYLAAAAADRVGRMAPHEREILRIEIPS